VGNKQKNPIKKKPLNFMDKLKKVATTERDVENQEQQTEISEYQLTLAKEIQLPLEHLDPNSEENKFITMRFADFKAQYPKRVRKKHKRALALLEQKAEVIEELPEEWTQKPLIGAYESERIMLAITPEERQDILNDIENFATKWKNKGYSVTLLDHLVVLHSLKDPKNTLAAQATERLAGGAQTPQLEQTIVEEIAPEEEMKSLKSALSALQETKPRAPEPPIDETKSSYDLEAMEDIELQEYPNRDLTVLDDKFSRKDSLAKNKQSPIDHDQFEPYRSLTPQQRLARAKKEWSIVTPGTVDLPTALSSRIRDLVSRYPKNSIRKTAQLLSATFRLRTGGYDNKMRLSKAGQGPPLLPSTNSSDLSLFDQQMTLLRELRGYKENAKMGRISKGFVPGGKRDRDAIANLGKQFDPPIVYGEYEAVAYACHRMPAIYATTRRVFGEISRRMPDWNPTSMLDFGSGTGTTIWAAKDTWTTSLGEIIAIEPSTAMMGIASKLLSGLSGLTWRRFLNEHSKRKYDVVVASYVLNELSSDDERARLVKSLWSVTKGVLVLVEAGTPMGFAQIRDARSIVLSQPWRMNESGGPATIVAPCPHDGPCPLAAGGVNGSWCHFVQRVQRDMHTQKITKPNITQPYEDEKFSYVVFRRKDFTGLDPDFENSELVTDAILRQEGVSKDERDLRAELRKHAREFAEQAHRWPRVITRPMKKGGHTIMDLCMSEGAAARVLVSRSTGKEAYRFSRKVWWGDLYPYELTSKEVKRVIDPMTAPIEESEESDSDSDNGTK
jgi:ribosomal protein RSM22 (predicted rRNA methylase)